MEFVRTIPASRLNPGNRTEPREQVNSITAFIDASSVYGSSLEEEEELRESEGHGYLLKFEASPQGPLLPRTERAICQRERDDPEDSPVCFIAGDERVNEQPALATIHTVFLRLHNLLASEMAARYTPASPLSPTHLNETLFQSTRRVVGAIVQKIMYGDWLPIILGQGYMSEFGLGVEDRSHYDPRVDPSILNEFSTAAYRMGHSLVPRNLPTPDPNPRRTRIRLRDHFLRPAVVRDRFNALAMGLVTANRTAARDQAQAIDSSVSRELSEHLFEPRRRRRGQDLMSLNIQRGRDHALQPYTKYRQLFGLDPVTDFSHPAIRGARRLDRVYQSVEDVDLFVGGLAEPPNTGGGQLGDTFSHIVAEQMRRLKVGDRFFFTHSEDVGFTDRQLRQLRNVTSAKIMCLTVDPITEIQLDAFVERGPDNPAVPCEQLVGDLSRDFLDVRDFVVEP
ncbi:chorion peroxidase-like [Babylonia areolata]